MITEIEIANSYIDREIMKAKDSIKTYCRFLKSLGIAKKKIQGMASNQYYEISLEGKIENYIVKTKAIGGERCKFKIIAAEHESYITNNRNILADGSLSLFWYSPWTYKPWSPENILLYISWEYKSNEFIGWLKNPGFNKE